MSGTWHSEMQNTSFSSLMIGTHIYLNKLPQVQAAVTLHFDYVIWDSNTDIQGNQRSDVTGILELMYICTVYVGTS